MGDAGNASEMQGPREESFSMLDNVENRPLLRAQNRIHVPYFVHAIFEPLAKLALKFLVFWDKQFSSSR
jgi:hypothetical protein